MSKVQHILKLLRAEGVREAISHTFWTWVFPALFAGLTMLAGILQDFPVMWILFVTAGVTAFVSHTLARLAEYQHVRTASFKLRFNRVAMGMIKTQDNKTFIKLGMELENLAAFALQYRVISINSSIGNRINPAPDHMNLGTEVGPKSTTIFWDSAIDVSDLSPTDMIEGMLQFQLKYGKHRRLNHEIEKRFRLFIGADYQKMEYFEERTDVAALRTKQKAT